jgi:ABC-type hemin transport system substrate-binding protein
MGIDHRHVAHADVTATHHRKSNRSFHDAKVAEYIREMRVVSLVPSWTEYLHDLGVHVVGQTKFCVRPTHAYRSIPRIGGTKTVDVDKVMALKPDLVVANKEENDRIQVEALRDALPARAEILVTDVRTVSAALEEMSTIGEAVHRKEKAREWTGRVRQAWGPARPVMGSAGYVVWSSPWMVAGRDTFIHDVMRHWGIGNACEGLTSPMDRYPTLADRPDKGASLGSAWLLPSEPFPFGDKHLRSLQSHHPKVAFRLVDGEAFSWYGSRMAHVTSHLESVAQWVQQTMGS